MQKYLVTVYCRLQQRTDSVVVAAESSEMACRIVEARVSNYEDVEGAAPIKSGIRGYKYDWMTPQC